MDIVQTAPFDLLLTRAGIEAEVVCDVVSAEDGRRTDGGLLNYKSFSLPTDRILAVYVYW